MPVVPTIVSEAGACRRSTPGNADRTWRILPNYRRHCHMIPVRPVLRGASDEATRPKHPAGTPSAPGRGRVRGRNAGCRGHIENGLQFGPSCRFSARVDTLDPGARSAAIRNPVRAANQRRKILWFYLGQFWPVRIPAVGRPRQFCRGAGQPGHRPGNVPGPHVPPVVPIVAGNGRAVEGLPRGGSRSALLPSSPAWYPIGVLAVCRGYRRFCRGCRRPVPAAFRRCVVPGDRLSAFPPCRIRRWPGRALSGCAKGRSTRARATIWYGGPLPRTVCYAGFPFNRPAMMALRPVAGSSGRFGRGMQGKKAVQFLVRGTGRFHVLHPQGTLVKVVQPKDGFPAGLVAVDLRGVEYGLLGVLDGKVGLLRGQLKLCDAGRLDRGVRL